MSRPKCMAYAVENTWDNQVLDTKKLAFASFFLFRFDRLFAN